ncbi:MAG: VWA domain-containing protein, partial [Planctomycetales bacterium]|nr:VWA domain-containing protein [Planctomycetales bacterium]
MWTTDPHIPMTLWWALAIAAVAAISWYAIRRDHALSLVRRLALALLLAMGLSGPLLIALNPTWVEPIPPVPGNPMVTVLIDGTLSMKTEDAGAGGSARSRWQRATEIAAAVPNDRSSVEVRQLAFSELVQPYTETTASKQASIATMGAFNAPADGWPHGHRTDLSMSLRRAIRTGSPLGHAVVLISDGAHNVGSVESVLQAASEASALATPVYTVTVGASVGIKNVSITARSPRIIAFPDNPILLRATVAHNGLAGQSTDVYLMQDNEVLQKRTVRLTPDVTHEVRFQVEEDAEQAMMR